MVCVCVCVFVLWQPTSDRYRVDRVASILAHTYVPTHVHLHIQGGDTSGYDEYIEGVEADETTSLETPIDEVELISRYQCVV